MVREYGVYTVMSFQDSTIGLHGITSDHTIGQKFIGNTTGQTVMVELDVHEVQDDRQDPGELANGRLIHVNVSLMFPFEARSLPQVHWGFMVYVLQGTDDMLNYM